MKIQFAVIALLASFSLPALAEDTKCLYSVNGSAPVALESVKMSEYVPNLTMKWEARIQLENSVVLAEAQIWRISKPYEVELKLTESNAGLLTKALVTRAARGGADQRVSASSISLWCERLK